MGALIGLGLVFVAVSPTKGVAPKGGSGGLAPAQIEVSAVGAGEFELDPLGTVLEATAFPLPGQRGGPTLAVTVRNITGLPLKISLRLVGLSPTLDRAVKVRASVAGGVALNGPLGTAAEWSKPTGVLRSGQQTTLRMRFKLFPGQAPDAWRGKLDVRQLELRAIKLDGQPVADSQTIPSTTTPELGSPTSPAPTTSTPPVVSGPPPIAPTTTP